MNHVWCNRLGPLAIAAARFLPPFSGRVYHAQKPSEAWRKLAALLGVGTVRLQPEMGQLDPAGDMLRYRIERNVQALRNRLRRLLEQGPCFLPESERAYREDWMRILLAHFVVTAGPLVQFSESVRNLYRTGKITHPTNGAVIILAQTSCLRGFLAAQMKETDEPGFRLTVLPTFRSLFAFDWFFGYALSPLADIIRAWKNGTCRANVSPAALGAGTVLSQHQKADLQRYPQLGHLSWFPYSNIAPERLVLYCNRADSRLETSDIGQIEAFGFSWLEELSPYQHLAAAPVVLLSCLRLAAPALGHVRRGLGFWTFACLAAFSLQLQAFRALVRALNVKILLQVHEAWPRPMLLSLAAKQEGAVFVWRPWAVDHFPSAMHANGGADVVLSWGQMNDGYFNAIGYSYKVLIQTGVIGQPGNEPQALAKGRELRAELDDSVTFVIALFDSSTSPDAHQSREQLLTFYRHVFAILKAHPHWGVLLKPKVAKALDFPEAPEVSSAINALQKDGRVLVLPPMSSPQHAANGADAAVCFSINSAGFTIADMSKIPVFHFDLCGFTHHPLYLAGGRDVFAFRDKQSLEQALELVSQGHLERFDYHAINHLYDPFADGQGNKRVSEVVVGLLDGLDVGLPLPEAIDSMSRRYAAKWGGEFVTRAGLPPPHQGNLMWRSVLASSGFPISSELQSSDRIGNMQ